MSNENELDALLDQTTEAIRNRQLSEEEVAASARKVWAKLESAGAAPPREADVAAPASRIRNCSDLQALIPEYLAGKLGESRRLLLEDHLNECVPCRRALRIAREGRKPATVLPRKQSLPWGWVGATGAAAAVLLVAALAWWGSFDEFLPAPSGARATVESVDGTLFRVAREGSAPIVAGTQLWEGDEIRTARLSGAVIRLRDGSRLELDARSQLTIHENRAGSRVQLDRGNIIVEAAPQGSGRLSVTTDDCQVTVKGTIFTVNHGTRGSRVAVLEGEVAVTRLGREQMLGPGQQFASREALQKVPLAREVAWSRQAPEHLKLVEQLNLLGQDLGQVFRTEARTSSALLPLVPADTAIYAAVPNLADSLGEAQRMFEQRLGENLEMQQWWVEHGEEVKEEVDQLVARLQSLGGQLGEEVVAALGAPDEVSAGPLILAEVVNEAALRAALASEIERINSSTEAFTVRLVENPFTETDSSGRSLYLMLRRGVFAVSPTPERLQAVAELLDSGHASSFVDSPFYARISEAYQNGVSYLVAVDLGVLISQAEGKSTDQKRERETLARLGVSDARYLLLERRPAGDLTETRAELSFAQARRGMASWLAEPAPMGALDFVSGDAKVAAAFVVKDPDLMVEDLFQLIQATDSQAWQELVDFQLERGINIQQDFAAPLGGEIAFALDGPVLPNPSWKVILEVYDPARLQQTIEWAIEEVNSRLAAEGEPRLELLAQPSGGRTFYTLVTPGRGSEVNYVFVDGYLVAAPSRALLLNAIRFRQTGYTLVRSPKFLERLPADRRANFSALMYQDLGSLLQPLAAGLGANEDIPEEAREQLQQLASQLRSSLFYAYAGPQRITLAGTGDDFSPFGIGGGLGSFMGVARLLHLGDQN